MKVKLGKKRLMMTTVRDISKFLELERQKQLQNLRTVAFA
jgi:hypothetical protein